LHGVVGVGRALRPPGQGPSRQRQQAREIPRPKSFRRRLIAATKLLQKQRDRTPGQASRLGRIGQRMAWIGGIYIHRNKVLGIVSELRGKTKKMSVAWPQILEFPYQQPL
jgi:hypothetical protein